MQAGMLPAPFHMTGSLPLSLATLLDKLSIARAMLDILGAKGHPRISKKWRSPMRMAAQARQTQGAIERFWRVCS